jgi:hypothetical protein
MRESELLYDWRFTANQFVLAPSPLRLTARIFFQLNTCDCSPYVTSSLTRGWVCRLQLLLILASAFILRSESRKTHDHILLSQIRDSPKLEPRSPYLYPPRTGWLSYTLRTGFFFRRFHDSQVYGGGNLNPPPHPVGPVCCAVMHKFEADGIKNRAKQTPEEVVICALH